MMGIFFEELHSQCAAEMRAITCGQYEDDEHWHLFPHYVNYYVIPKHQRFHKARVY